MSFKTGIYRLAQVAKWSGRLLGGLLVAVGVAAALFGSGERLDTLGIAVFSGLLVLAVTQPLAWVLEGFAKE